MSTTPEPPEGYEIIPIEWLHSNTPPEGTLWANKGENDWTDLHNDLAGKDFEEPSSSFNYAAPIGTMSNPPAQPQGTDYRVRMLMEGTHEELVLEEITRITLDQCSAHIAFKVKRGDFHGRGETPTAAILSALASYDRKEGK